MFQSAKALYKSKQWRDLLEKIKLERVSENGELLCGHCGKPILKKYDCIGHHSIELTADNLNDYSVSLNPDNIQLIHFECHNQIHERFEGFTQTVYLVYGAPCSGKSSWVRDVATNDDLILDVDRIWKSISVCGEYEKPNRLKKNVFGIRDCVIDQIRTRTGMWKNAYIIGGYPLRSERDRLCDLLNAEPIYIEATKEECLERAWGGRPEAWKQYIEDWFLNYTE